MYVLDPRADHAALGAFHAEAAVLLELPDEVLFARAPEVSGWSAGQQLFHVLLANELAFRNVRLLLEGGSAWIVERAAPTFLGHLILVWNHMPRGVGQSPRAVRPPDRPDRGIVLDTLRENRERHAELASTLDELVGTPGAIPHRELGPLGAAHWLFFARLHGQHHLALARDVLAGLGQPVTR